MLFVSFFFFALQGGFLMGFTMINLQPPYRLKSNLASQELPPRNVKKNYFQLKYYCLPQTSSRERNKVSTNEGEYPCPLTKPSSHKRQLKHLSGNSHHNMGEGGRVVNWVYLCKEKLAQQSFNNKHATPLRRLSKACVSTHTYIHTDNDTLTANILSDPRKHNILTIMIIIINEIPALLIK